MLFFFLLLGAVVAGIVHASSLAYVNDDAFISFRYARNLVRGLGLVYNAGERVEGYTNFLWTLLVAGAMKLGIDPVGFTMAAGITFYTFTLILFGFLSWRMAGETPGAAIILPLTSLALACHHDVAVYATSGLETSMTTFFVATVFALMVAGTTVRAHFLAGICAVLSLMTRPDTVLFVAVSVAFIGVMNPRPTRNLLAFLAPITFLFIPYWIIRWNYYGFVFPNSFYAKSIDLPYYDNGIIYVRLFLQEYYVFLLLLPLAGVVAWMNRRSSRSLDARNWIHRMLGELRSADRSIVLAVSFILLQVLFVVRIGGDFMFARMLIVITPYLFILFERYIGRFSNHFVVAGLSALVIVLTILRNDLFAGAASIGYVTDERQVYTDAHLARARKTGIRLHELLSGTDLRVAFWGERARLIYYMDPPVAIEAATGLTDTTIAHQHIRERTRPGHEKKASFEFLLGKRVNFFFFPYDLPERVKAIDRIYFDSIPARIMLYDTSVMNRLRNQPDIRFVDFPEFLDRYMESAGTMEPERLRMDYQRFRQYYFRYSDDPEREGRILSLIHP